MACEDGRAGARGKKGNQQDSSLHVMILAKTAPSVNRTSRRVGAIESGLVHAASTPYLRMSTLPLGSSGQGRWTGGLAEAATLSAVPASMLSTAVGKLTDFTEREVLEADFVGRRGRRHLDGDQIGHGEVEVRASVE